MEKMEPKNADKNKKDTVCIIHLFDFLHPHFWNFQALGKQSIYL